MDGSQVQRMIVRSPYGDDNSVTLTVQPLTMDDLDDFYELHSDKRVWVHLPSGRHTDIKKTEKDLAALVAEWKTDLSYWSVRSLGELAGVGGARLIGNGTVWNLYYRVSPAWWGCGIAGTLATMALQAAQVARPELPVVAYLLEHNEASRRIAEKVLQLELRWRGPDAGNTDPTAIRLVFSDRPLDEAALSVVST